MKKQISEERQRQIQQLALQLQNEKLDQRYKTIRWLLVCALLLGTLAYMYSEYANKRVNSSRENVIAQLNHHIGLAAGGDEEIQNRLQIELPLLQQYVQAQLDKDGAVGNTGTKANTFSPVTAFVRIDNSTLSIGEIFDAEDIATIDDSADAGENWLTVTLNDGLPVWVNSAFVERSEQSLFEGTTTARIGMHRSPNLRSDSVVAVIDAGVQLSLIEVEGQWIKVKTPEDFQFIIRKREYERLIAENTP